MVFYFKARPEVGDYTIFMGFDKFENEELIKYGFLEDIWFHVDKMSSAHVYLRLNKGQTIDDISEGLLEDCAQLVKANSIQGNKVNNIDVVYTPWFNLKKTASMDVGQVGFHNSKMPMKFGWQIVVGSLVGFLGAAFGSVGGVGGGGIFVPMLALIIGFDPKSSTAISKCMIMGAAGSTVYYNLKLRHPTLDMPIIDYNLAVLMQPMLMLGISIGVVFNVVFPDWLVTVLLIIIFLFTSTKAFLRGVDTWKKETIMKKEAIRRAEGNGSTSEGEYRPLPSGPDNHQEVKANLDAEVPILENVRWKELGLLVFVWIAFLVLQIIKNYIVTCSIWYWVVNLLQIPVSVGVSVSEAVSLYRGKSVIASRGNVGTEWKVVQLVLYCACGVIGGIVGGLLGLGGGFILGPLFLELGIPPQVSSATATFAMTFSSSMSVVEYYLLHRFPVPYAVYFVIVATIAAWIGQHLVRKLIVIMGRASLIIFILAATILISALSLGGVGIANIIKKMENQEYMGFENLCKYQV